MKYLFLIAYLILNHAVYSQQDELDGIIRKIDEKERLNGVVLIGKDGRIIYQNAFGLANYSLNTPNSLDSKFLIGSLTKQFTAMLILQYVQEGKLNLDENIIKYLPDFRTDIGNKISIRHLLTHTHGIPNAELNHRYESISKNLFIKKYCEKELEFEAGSSFKYSEIVGYYILGAILETVSEKEYGTLLSDNIFGPLNMKNSGYYNHESIINNFSSGHLVNQNSLRNAPYWDISQSFSAAGIYSTAYDLFLWDKALRNEQLVSKKYIDMMFTPYSEKVRYGFGWYINDPVINGKRRIFPAHTGGANGYKSAIIRGTDDNLVVIYLSNFDKYVELRYTVLNYLLSEK